MQFNLRFLFAFMSCAGVAIYALIHATRFGAVVSFTACIGVLLSSILLAVVASGKSRYFWLGFAVFGWGYWLVLHSPILDLEDGARHNWRVNSEEGPPLITSRYLAWVYFSVLPLVHDEPQLEPSQQSQPPLSLPPPDGYGLRIQQTNSTYPSEIEFMRVGHSLCAMLFGLIGGGIGLFAFRQYHASSSP